MAVSISNAIIAAIFILSQSSNVRGNMKTDCWKECKGIQNPTRLRAAYLPSLITVRHPLLDQKVAGIPHLAAGARFTQPFDRICYTCREGRDQLIHHSGVQRNLRRSRRSSLRD